MTVPDAEVFSSLKDLQGKIGFLRGKSLKDHQRLIQGLGQYFRITLPSNLNDAYILEVEQLLNGLYVQADNENWPQEIKTTVLDALTKVGFLSDTIKRGSGGARNPEFFEKAKQLGDVLLLVNQLVALDL
jgi:hypothetical protein